MIFSGYSYDDVGPHLIFCDIDSGNYKKQYMNKESFTLQKSDKRYCIGIYNLSTLSYSPCTKKFELDPYSKINNCNDCYIKIGFNPAFYNAQKISPQQSEYNKTPHVVYLAYFSPSHVKVGIASERRVQLRLLEQGARAAFILKTFPNAYLARELEAKLCHSDYGILERLLSGQKLKILCENNYDSETANKTLTDILKQTNIVPESEFLEFDSKYFYNNHYSLSDIENIKDAEVLSGEAIGMVGDIVILRQEHTLFAIASKKFISHEIEIKDGTDFIKYEIEAKQVSLW